MLHPSAKGLCGTVTKGFNRKRCLNEVSKKVHAASYRGNNHFKEKSSHSHITVHLHNPFYAQSWFFFCALVPRSRPDNIKSWELCWRLCRLMLSSIYSSLQSYLSAVDLSQRNCKMWQRGESWTGKMFLRERNNSVVLWKPLILWLSLRQPLHSGWCHERAFQDGGLTGSEKLRTLWRMVLRLLEEGAHQRWKDFLQGTTSPVQASRPRGGITSIAAGLTAFLET